MGWPHCVAREPGRAEHCTVGAPAQRIVERRHWQHFDLVDDAIDAGQPCDTTLGIGFCRRTHDFAVKRHRSAIDFERTPNCQTRRSTAASKKPPSGFSAQADCWGGKYLEGTGSATDVATANAIAPINVMILLLLYIHFRFPPCGSGTALELKKIFKIPKKKRVFFSVLKGCQKCCDSLKICGGPAQATPESSSER